MPDEITTNPDEQNPSPNIDLKIPAGNHDEIEPKRNSRATKDETEEAIELRGIKKGERYLIYVGAAGVVLNIVIALIYYGQLTQMRAATELSGNSLQVSSMQTKLTAEAISDSNHSLKQTFGKMDAQIRAANRLATASSDNAQSAKSAVSIAEDNLELARESLRVQERPWINTLAFDGVFENDTIVAKISIHNFGKSPAFDIGLSGGWYLGDQFIGNPLLTTGEQTYSVLMPGSTKELSGTPDYVFDLNKRLSVSQIAAFKQGRLKINFIVLISYHDQWTRGKTAPHKSRSCGYWTGDSKKFFDVPRCNDAN